MQHGNRLYAGMAGAQCEVATRPVGRLGLGADVVEAVGQTFERWDGRGLPRGLSGEEICEIARVMQVAYVSELALYSFGVEGASALLRDRAGASLDPSAVEAALGLLGAFSARDATSAWSELASLAPRGDEGSGGADGVVEAFADFVDLKSTFLAGHSFGVAALADGAAAGLGFGEGERLALRRAALLHDYHAA